MIVQFLLPINFILYALVNVTCAGTRLYNYIFKLVDIVIRQKICSKKLHSSGDALAIVGVAYVSNFSALTT